MYYKQTETEISNTPHTQSIQLIEYTQNISIYFIFNIQNKIIGKYVDDWQTLCSNQAAVT